MKLKLAWITLALVLSASSACSRKPSEQTAPPKPQEKPSASPATAPESPKEEKSQFITYRSPDGKLGIVATDFSGICNITVTRDSANGPTETTSEMSLATFAKLTLALAQNPALSSHSLDKEGAEADTETHHIITVTEQSASGSSSKMYGIPEKDAPAEFREWLSLLEKSGKKS